jgi:glutaredoxin-like protein NrdH
MDMKHVDGEKRSDLVLYALSTCVWCKKTKAFLSDLRVGYDYVNVDELAGQEREQALAELQRWNPKCSFPSLVVNSETCVVGYDEEKIKEALGV